MAGSLIAEGDLSRASGQQAKRVAGLDSIRLVCALWVVFNHFGFIPLFGNVSKSTFVGKALVGSYNNLVSGPAAVIVFFVISGFCIHYPFRKGQPLSPVPYYSRRYIRILTPMFFAILLARPLGINLTLLNDSILWSLLAEEIYYAVYPLLSFLGRRFGWMSLLSVAYAGSVLVILRDPSAGNYPSYGPYLNWLLGLPCWLLGCYLAENFDRLKNVAVSRSSIWLWRGGALALSAICSALRFHSPIKYPWTLNLFAVFVFFWLGREIAYYMERRPFPVLENNGRWSYSIYLIHLHAQALFLLLAPALGGGLFGWLARNAFILLVCFAFYAVVEKPSHLMARRFATKIAVLTSPRILPESAA
ncbi:MAG: acyltransferase family protein [Pyrinomonadaceae bacterium]